MLAALAFIPASSFAQRRAAGAHAGGARPGVVRAPQAPVARAPVTGVSRPTTASPVFTRPIVTRPTGISPLTTLSTPVAPLRTPTMTSGIRFPSRPPLRFPITPVRGTFGFLGYSPFFGYNPFLGYTPFWLCSGFGFGYGCGMLPVYSGVGYIPPVYPAAEPAYPSDPVYTPADSSATLQYTPLLNEYPSVGSFPAEDLAAPAGASAQLRNETLLYLKDGSVFAVSSYTVTNGLLHYVTAYGEQNDLLVDLLDLRKTIETNAARGVAFTLTPPDPSAPRDSKPTPLGPAPAPEGPITPPRR